MQYLQSQRQKVHYEHQDLWFSIKQLKKHDPDAHGAFYAVIMQILAGLMHFYVYEAKIFKKSLGKSFQPCKHEKMHIFL